MKVLIIGLGSIAKKHIAALKEIDKYVQITALRSSENATQFQDITNAYNINELKEITFDFGIISSPTSNHKDDIEQLLAFKIPLFIEKPLYHKLDLMPLLEKVNLLNIKTYVACNLRFLACINFVKEYLQHNKQLKVNEVNVYCGSYMPEWRENSNYKDSYSSNPSRGGGVHLDLIHELDYIYWLFGSPNNVLRIFRSKSSIDIQSIDYAHYSLNYDDFDAVVTLNYFRRDPKRSLEIIFDEYTLNVDILKNIVKRNNEVLFKSEQKAKDTYKIQLEYFIEHLSKNSFNDINEAYEVLKICIDN